jgi:kynurenine formamidase
MMSAESRKRTMRRADPSRVYDLSVELFLGMPSWSAYGEPPFQIWMNHTPQGTVVDNLSEKTREINERIGYSSDSVTMITHTGTHIDSLNHWGYGEAIWNGFEAKDCLGSRHWTKCGVDKIPPIVARGVLLDVAAAKGVDMLPTSNPITVDDLRETAARERVELEPGDVVLIRTGWMNLWDEPQRYMFDAPGINVEAAQWLVEGHGAMILGADQPTVEYQPATDVPGHYQPVHLYLLAEQGVPMLEILYLEELARDRVYECAFFGAPVRFRGGTGAPIRPWVMPFQNDESDSA